MRRNYLILMISCLMFSACQQNLSETKNQSAKSSPPISSAPNAAPSETFDKSQVKTFNGKGTVTKINLELVSVEIDHEEIKGLMPKMIMEFFVKEKAELEVLKIGDRVDFVLEDKAGQEKIISIKKAK